MKKQGVMTFSLSVVGSEWKEKSPRLVGQVNTREKQRCENNEESK